MTTTEESTMRVPPSPDGTTPTDRTDEMERLSVAVAAMTPCSCSAQRARAESAEAEVGRLRAKVAAVEALVRDWPCSDEYCDGDCTGCAYAEDLRAALATTGEGQSTETTAPYDLHQSCRDNAAAWADAVALGQAKPCEECGP